MSAAPNSPKPPGFFRSHILPVLLIFLIPGFSTWFFKYAENDFDEKFIASIEREVKQAKNIPAEQKPMILEFHRKVPPSKIMASDEPALVQMQPMFEDAKTPYLTFRWMKRIAWFCLAAVGVTFVVVGLSVAFSMRSQSAQYKSLRIGWPMLQISAATQVLGQAVLLVALSYWVTAIFGNVYYVKLVIIAALLAGVAVLALWKATFAKVDDRMEANGQLVTEADAPALWQRTRDMAMKLNTAPPDQIIAGIEPTFYVTEHPVILGDKELQGRTLYVSLPMLKVLTTDEADAVLGHELAHFSGEDTLWSRKVGPLLSRFGVYMGTLAQGVGLIVAYFIQLFWKLYGLSITRLSRLREFRADAVGAQLVSKDAAKRALVKTTVYGDFQNDTERAVVESNELKTEVNVPLRLAEGYPQALHAFVTSPERANEVVPHPFDTHPTLHQRLAQLGFNAHEALTDPALGQPVQSSWYHAITTAPELEARLWADRQNLLKGVQTEQLAWRLVPKTEEELALVQEHFPPVVFRDKSGATAMLAFDRVQFADSDTPILFKDITKAEATDALKGKLLTLTVQPPDGGKPQKVKVYPMPFTHERGDLLSAFGFYYSRHQQAELHNQQ